ncbi:MAG: D-alanyl-D-alanine carboxypeptidase family protein [Alphaproteobacteria bacterium]
MNILHKAARPDRVLALLCVGWLTVVGTAQAFETAAREAFLIDFGTGSVLLEKDADQPTPPASMSKMMTIYMLFERLAEGAVSLDDSFNVSEKAWRMGGSKMFIEVDSSVRVEDLIRGIVVQSGNDACIVVAEALAGSEDAFAQAMTERGREIGLIDSSFTNSTGWPDPAHFVTARDLATLTQRIIVDFPEYFHYFAEQTFTYNEIKQSNRNPLLFKDIGADGMKTGHTEEAGYGLTATAERNGRRLILVITGLESVRARAAEAERILGWGFRETKNYTLFEGAEEIETADVWLGVQATVPLILPDDLTITMSRAARKKLEVKVVLESPVPAPIAKGSEIATLVISAPEFTTIRLPLQAGADVERLGYFGRVWATLIHTVFGAVGL